MTLRMVILALVANLFIGALSLKADDNSSNYREYVYNDLDQTIAENTYKYDGLNKGELISSASFIYDIRGNVISKTTTTGGHTEIVSYVYNDIDQLLSSKKVVDGSASSNAYAYDLNGNMTGIDNGSLFSYNELNQLVRYVDTARNADVSYSYNAESLRKSKAHTQSSDAIYYYYQNSEILNEADSNGNMSSYFMAHDRVAREYNNSIEFYLKNQKDIVGTTDGSKQTKTYAYTSYGQDIDLNAGNLPSASGTGAFSIADNPFKYSGYYSDSESGMYYLLARYYSPELMRFISRDTYDVSNRYAYCDGNPVSKTDPSGHLPKFLGSTWFQGMMIGLSVLTQDYAGAAVMGASLALSKTGHQKAANIVSLVGSSIQALYTLGMAGAGGKALYNDYHGGSGESLAAEHQGVDAAHVHSSNINSHAGSFHTCIEGNEEFHSFANEEFHSFAENNHSVEEEAHLVPLSYNDTNPASIFKAAGLSDGASGVLGKTLDNILGDKGLTESLKAQTDWEIHYTNKEYFLELMDNEMGMGTTKQVELINELKNVAYHNWTRVFGHVPSFGSFSLMANKSDLFAVMAKVLNPEDTTVATCRLRLIKYILIKL